MKTAGFYEYYFKGDETNKMGSANEEMKAAEKFIKDVIKKAGKTGYIIERIDNEENYEIFIRNSILDVEYVSGGIKGNNKKRVAGELYLYIFKDRKHIEIGIPSDSEPPCPRYGGIWCLTGNASFSFPDKEKIILNEKYKSNIVLIKTKGTFRVKSLK